MINIAIDGPSGAGKSTVAKRLSKELGYLYIDTGALYRAVGYYILNAGISPNDKNGVEKALCGIEIGLTYDENGSRHVWLNGKDISENILSLEISKYASNVSALPCVRAFLLETQREIARNNNVLMDGRDIGTVVLPDAQVKIYLTATAEDRANRRYLDLKESGETYESVLASITERDYNDMNRIIAPLKQADDAVLVDTTGCSAEQGYEKLKAAVIKQMERHN